jgi:hypothetical protein
VQRIAAAATAAPTVALTAARRAGRFRFNHACRLRQLLLTLLFIPSFPFLAGRFPITHVASFTSINTHLQTLTSFSSLTFFLPSLPFLTRAASRHGNGHGHEQQLTTLNHSLHSFLVTSRRL